MRREIMLVLTLLAILPSEIACCSTANTSLGVALLASDMPNEFVSATIERPSNGYTLFAPMSSQLTYLIDNSGEVVHTWESYYYPDLSAYLLENGSLLRTGKPGLVQKIDWNGTVVWEFEYSNEQHLRHHDVEPLPNGNVLMIAWEFKTPGEAIAAGRDPSLLGEELWPDHVVEVEPHGLSGGDIVWEWHVWDHLIQDFNYSAENYGVVADHPELIDINVYGRPGPDWNHINSIDYNEEFDQILLSVNVFREIWVLDHSTTTEEAAGHTGGNSGKGGDLLYRWGNPQTYRAGDAEDQKFFQQHDAKWIELESPGAGNILVFNNGRGRPDGSYSSVDEIIPPVDGYGNYFMTPGSAFGPAEQTWIYTAEPPSSLYSSGISGAQRLPNGNTLVCDGQGGVFFEVTQGKDVIWEYTNHFPSLLQNNVFKTYRYGWDFPGLLDLVRPNDVAITNITTDKNIMLQGEEVVIDVVVENQGVYPETFNVTIYANATEVGRKAVSNLSQGATHVLGFTWNTSGVAGGNYTVDAVADSVANETDTLDNTLTYSSNLKVLFHDTSVVCATLLKTIVGQGYPIHLNVTIRNHGDFNETVNVTLNASSTVIQTFENITMDPQALATVSFVWNTSGYTEGNYTLYAYTCPVDGETDVENNVFAIWVLVTIPGDVDGDRDVDIYDIVAISAAYGTSKPDPEYDPYLDIDGDNDIDIYDIVLAAGNYGRSW